MFCHEEKKKQALLYFENFAVTHIYIYMFAHACMHVWHMCMLGRAPAHPRTRTHAHMYACIRSHTRVQHVLTCSHREKSIKSHIIAEAAVKEQIKLHQGSNLDCGHCLDTGWVCPDTKCIYWGIKPLKLFLMTLLTQKHKKQNKKWKVPHFLLC